MGQPGIDLDYALADRYARESGRVYITGIQALVRLPLMQRQRDLAAGLNTAGFISGYRGSPLGGYDLALWEARPFLERAHVHFEPGVNEDLAATAVWGSQLVHQTGRARYDGVFGIWYGKGPGVDRSCDALKHGNYAGAAKHGGVLVLCGDDPGAKSSSIAHQSEPALVHMGIPILNPSNVQDYLDFGLYGWAASRYSGCWIGFKCLTDTVESASSVFVGPERTPIALPADFELPDSARSGAPVASEQALYHFRLPAVQAFARANGLDRVMLDSPRRRIGIVTTGKAYLDVRQALESLGIDRTRAEELGLSVYKVALVWPLEPEGAQRFARGLASVLVVEEKRGLIEEQLAALLYNHSERPRIEGKRDANGAPLVPDTGELGPGAVEQVLRAWLERHAPEQARSLRAPRAAAPIVLSSGGLARMPAYCSGCPHNSSTVFPEGSLAGGGIGCHGMAAWMPSRRTTFFTHMGGEGANWVGMAPFTDTPHIFQHLGDGTYFHSGLLAIRQNVTAGTNITYKILVNGAVAMTGGQPIEGESLRGEITCPEIAHQLRAEGVQRIAVLTNDLARYRGVTLPAGATLHHRDEILAVQRELREVPGVSALIFDQTCAAELRRLRKRGELPEPERRVVINELVCEGCGDCSVQSNCISIEPVETEFGRKRRINQSSCNKDYSCLKGYCPSFATVVGGRLRRAAVQAADPGGGDPNAYLPLPEPAALDRPFEILVTGIGGTGVITIGALLGMAAHLEGKGASVLDVTGLAQKNGPVTSHVRIATHPEALHATRIAAGAADLLLGCDIVVSTSPENLAKLAPGRTTALVNSHVTPTSAFADDPDLDLSSAGMEAALRAAAGEKDAHFVRASELATALLGDAIYTNPFLMGYAFQLGRLPLTLGSLMRAIELNGRAVAENQRAFGWGRLAAHDLAAVERAAAPALRESAPQAQPASLAEMVERRARFLVDYQDERLAARYRARVERIAARERAVAPGSEALARAVARYHFKLLAYKDEYEIARLWTGPEFRAQLEAEFEGDYRLELHLAPQILNRRHPETGRARKWTLGPWFFTALRLLAKLKFLRGGPLDFFGMTRHRRAERALISEYERILDELESALTRDNLELAVQIASIPEHVRGYDTVKERHLEEARTKQAELLAAFRLRAPAAAVERV
jgi:indolepyruvate ferredoxin oxidoreductase